MKQQQIDTIIVGGGQAGLATSYHLGQRGLDNLVLEQAAVPAPVWQNERWDSFTLVTPNWMCTIPGVEYSGPDPDGFLPRQEIVAMFERYVEQYRLPVQCNTRVTAIEPNALGGYRVQTAESTFLARNVVVATGRFQQPKIPAFATNISPRVTQIASTRYRNPHALPEGAVLVVGTGQSGCQIAEELYQSGRTVYLSTGRAGRVPRRYRGKDIIAWVDQTGFLDLTPDHLPPGMSRLSGVPHISGAKGGHTINLHQFARDGVRLLGHLQSADGATLTIARDLQENLSQVDRFEQEALGMIDGFIEAHGFDAPLEDVPSLRDGFAQPIVDCLNLKAAGITTIIWAIGYSFDYSLINLPITDGEGFPIQNGGVTNFPGLYFVGMPWMPAERSGFIGGVRDFSERIAEEIAGREG